MPQKRLQDNLKPEVRPEVSRKCLFNAAFRYQKALKALGLKPNRHGDYEFPHEFALEHCSIFEFVLDC